VIFMVSERQAGNVCSGWKCLQWLAWLAGVATVAFGTTQHAAAAAGDLLSCMLHSCFVRGFLSQAVFQDSRKRHCCRARPLQPLRRLQGKVQEWRVMGRACMAVNVNECARCWSRMGCRPPLLGWQWTLGSARILPLFEGLHSRVGCTRLPKLELWWCIVEQVFFFDEADLLGRRAWM
jgi:hypothetical protein